MDLAEAAILERLLATSTATVTSLLAQKGLRNVWVRGAFPLTAERRRVAGRAFTMRFIAGREDFPGSASQHSLPTTRMAIEAMGEGCMAVVECCGKTDVGTFGDLLCARMAQRGVAALIMDGAIRDGEGVAATGLPVWSSGIAAPPSAGSLLFVGWQMPINCGGTAIFPGDFIIADEDGAVVIPAHMASGIAAGAAEFDAMERWIAREISRGVPLPGLYPMDEETRQRYLAGR